MRLRGAVLWRDHGEPARWVRGDFGIEDGRIRRFDASPAGAGRTAAPDLVGYAIPGLVDAHCHLGIGLRRPGAPQGPVDRGQTERQALVERRCGVLLARDCGVPVDNAWIQERPDLPRLIRCGRHIARAKRYTRTLARELDDPADLPRAMAEEARRSDGWVKIVGDWIDRSRGADSDLEPLWPTSALVDGVAAAHEAGARVTAHAFSHAAIDGLLQAGVDGIEHGTGMDADQLAEAAARGIPITPTVLQVESFERFAERGERKYPRWAATMRAMYATRWRHLRAIVAAGVQLLPGGDTGGEQPHGSMPRELALWARIGLSPAQVLDLATWRARDFLGAPSLEDGSPADLVVYAEDPRRDLSVLRHPAAVVLRGRVVEGPGR